MPENTTRSQAGNPYRRPKPSPNEIIGGGKFYLANKKGSYGVNTSPVELALCREYLWVSETLSIPLSSITDTGLSKHGGYIRFSDSIARVETEFNFTKLGFLRFKRKDVEALLAIVGDHLPKKTPEPAIEVALAPDSDETANCERCGSTEARVFVFHVFRFIGIAPIAYTYKLTPLRYVLCAEHARSEAISCSRRTALAGYLGFPGFIAAPWYICKNLWALRGSGVAEPRAVLLCLLSCVILPCALIATPIILLTW